MTPVSWFLVIMSVGWHYATTVPMQSEHACIVAKQEIYTKESATSRCVSSAGDVE